MDIVRYIKNIQQDFYYYRSNILVSVKIEINNDDIRITNQSSQVNYAPLIRDNKLYLYLQDKLYFSIEQYNSRTLKIYSYLNNEVLYKAFLY